MSNVPQIVYPPRFDQRVLALEAAGGPPVGACLVVPTITAVGEPFAVRLALTDENGLPSLQFRGSVTVRCEAASPREVEVPLEAGRPAVAAVDGLTIASEGLFRFQAQLGGRTFHSNPTCSRARPDRFCFWGDPHIHTVLSNCHPDRCRSLNFCYVAARHLSALDWASAADHVSNGRCDFAKWKAQCAACNAFDDPPAFVTLPAYEASLKGGAGGDNNVYMLRQPDMFVDEYEQGDVRTLAAKLSDVLDPSEFFVVPHHTTRTGKHGEIGDAIYPGDDLMPVVEIHSKWGTSEYRGNPGPLEKIHPGPSYVVDLLNRGLWLGFVGGTDTHTTLTGPTPLESPHILAPPGLTAVFAGRLSREEIFRGIRGRDCYAAKGERIYLDVTIAGSRPGRSVAWADGNRPREIRATAAARSDIERIELVRNGRTVRQQSVGTWQGGLDCTDADELGAIALASPHIGSFVYYYVRVTCASGAQAWSSPVWLQLS